MCRFRKPKAGELERLRAASAAATFTSPQTQNSLRMLFGDRMPRSAFKSSRDIVMSHEFCGEIVDYGPSTTRKLKAGTTVCSMPFLIREDGLRFIGYSDETPGGYGEYMRLTESLLLEVPNDLPPAHAALAEPMVVGVHAVEKVRPDKNDVPLVIGCGPIGLAVVAALNVKGIHPICRRRFLHAPKTVGNGTRGGRCG